MFICCDLVCYGLVQSVMDSDYNLSRFAVVNETFKTWAMRVSKFMESIAYFVWPLVGVFPETACTIDMDRCHSRCGK